MTDDTEAALRAEIECLTRERDEREKVAIKTIRRHAATLAENHQLERERDALHAALEQARESLSVMVGQDMFEDQTDSDLVLLFGGPKIARQAYMLSVKEFRRARSALKAAEEALKSI